MAYSEFQADRIRERLKHLDYSEKKMMGGLIFMVRNTMCVGLDFNKKTNEDRLMVRVGKLQYDHLLNQHGSVKMDFTGREMRGFLFIDASSFDLEEQLDFWIDKALQFNKELSRPISGAG